MLIGAWGYPVVVLILSDAEIFSVPLSAIGLSSWEKCLFKSLARF